jgi:hypothetical protein
MVPPVAVVVGCVIAQDVDERVAPGCAEGFRSGSEGHLLDERAAMLS